MVEAIAPGSRVRLRYALSLADGRAVDASPSDAPLEIVVGQGDLFESLERRLIGLSAGAHRRFEIPADETALSLDGENVQELARADFPPEFVLRSGELVAFEMPNGEEVAGLILAVDDERVSVDFAHPLAGRDLVFEVDILEVAPAHGSARDGEG